MARLRIEFSGTRTEVSLKGGAVTVGRSNRCSINLPDKSLADEHFRIEKKARGYRVKDDGSGIGTLVNGKPVYATTLAHGDVILAGKVRCTFLDEAAAPERAEEEEAVPVAGPAQPISARGRKKRSRAQLGAMIGAFVVIAAAVVFFVMRPSPDDEAKVYWADAKEVLARADAEPARARELLAQAAVTLRKIKQDYARARIAATASVRLNEVEKVLKGFERIDAERKLVETELDAPAELDLRARLDLIRRTGHPGLLAAIRELEQELDDRRERHVREALHATETRAADALGKERYAEALRAWQECPVTDYGAVQRVQREIAALERQASQAYRSRLKLAGRSKSLDARVAMLEACRPVFAGTRHSSDLEVRIGALRARMQRRDVVVLKKPTPGKQPRKGTTPSKATPKEPIGPYEDPPKVGALIKQRRYAEAASVLHGISRHPDAKTRIEELTLLGALMADLVAAIDANPAGFTQVLLPNSTGRADATGADAGHLKTAQTQYAWEDFSAKAFVRLFRAAGFEKPPRLAVAIFFDEADLPKEAGRAYVAYFRSEQGPTTLTRILARRRGIPPPKAGFQLFRGQLVTAEEQAGILLGEQIDKLSKQAVSLNERRRKEAWDELEKLGEPALEALVAAVAARRTNAVADLKASKAFTPRRFAARYGKELEKRRKHALAFILDAKAYPYPNKSAEAQKEAEKRVDAVRELYEKPFGPLLKASEEAQALDTEVSSLDAYLARLDPLSEPMHEQVVEEIEKGLNMREVAIDDRDNRRIDYNLSIEKYNVGVKTTADSEERANVKAVNAYRWMMGLHAVKIDERLVRAARKHSIEMQQLKYFAHDSPTPHLRTPSMRAKREGYPSGAAENIARGPASGVAAFWAWFRSSGHHRNMLLGHTELGCGAAGHHWWTQKFGRATGKSLSPPKVPPDPDPPGQSGNGQPAPQ
ncbi:MAG: FHA domain-containing protein [Planctomycetota bacterium]|jgi:uncharacterized protein YkwD